MELRAAREASGKTQAQVAKEIGVSERSYVYYEKTDMEPGVKTAIRMSESLGIKDFEKFKALFGAATPDNSYI